MKIRLMAAALALGCTLPAMAAPCEAEIQGNDAMKFDKASIDVPKS